MSASLVFSFPVDIDGKVAVATVAAHFGIQCEAFDNLVAIPAHIKQAVETVGKELIAAKDVPDVGANQSPALAFAGLVNGGNVPAASSADAATQPNAPVVPPVGSQTSVPASSHPAPPSVPDAPTASAVQTNPANVDSTGLPWDARIHSDPAKVTDKGVWRKRRGVLPALVKQVEDELRAMGNVVNAQPAVTTQTTSNTTATAVFPDGESKKRAAVEHAHRVAVETLGGQLIDGPALEGLLQGKQTTLSPEQNDWFVAYFSKRNSAYAEFMNAAQVVAPVETPPAPSAPFVDATGLKWDARIHATPAALDSAGVYVQRMDVPVQTKLDVMAELRGGNAVQAQSTVPDTPASTVPPSPPVVSATPYDSFPSLMRWIVGNVMKKTITNEQVCEVAGMFGFIDPASGKGSIQLAAQRTEMFQQLVETLKMYGAD